MTVGEALIALLDDQLESELARKTSLEARGLAVITTSGTLVTLLLALAAVITKAQKFTPSLGPRILLIGAVGAFLTAAALGIYCNVPARYDEIEPESLRGLVDTKVWTAPGEEAQREIAEARLGVLEAARRANAAKALAVVLAAAIEVAAVALTAIAAGVILAQG